MQWCDWRWAEELHLNSVFIHILIYWNLWTPKHLCFPLQSLRRISSPALLMRVSMDFLDGERRGETHFPFCHLQRFLVVGSNCCCIQGWHWLWFSSKVHRLTCCHILLTLKVKFCYTSYARFIGPAYPIGRSGCIFQCTLLGPDPVKRT